MKTIGTRLAARPFRSDLFAAVVVIAILGGLTACGGPTSTPVARADPTKPTATALQTVAASPAPTVAPTQIRTATPVPTPIRLGIGDSCLVGRWTLTSLVMTDTVSLPGVTLTFTGQVGTVLTLGAEGTEVYDLTTSTPVVGSGSGHSLSWQGQGVQRFQFHGEDGQWWESGPGQTTTGTHVVVDGVAQPDIVGVAPPIAGSYTCSASTLTMTADHPVVITQTFRK